MNTQWELALLQLRIWVSELRSAPARGGMSDEISYTAVAVGGAIAVGAVIVAALIAKAEGINF